MLVSRDVRESEVCPICHGNGYTLTGSVQEGLKQHNCKACKGSKTAPVPWPLSFHHRAARTVEEIEEVLRAVKDFNARCTNTADLQLLQTRNMIIANLACYSEQYVELLLKYHGLLKQLVHGLSKFGEFDDSTRVGGTLKEIDDLDLSLLEPKEEKDA